MASAVSGKVGEDIIKGKGVLHFVIFFNEVRIKVINIRIDAHGQNVALLTSATGKADDAQQHTQ